MRTTRTTLPGWATRSAAAVVIVGALAGILPAPASAAASNFSDGFETYDVGAFPTSPYYTFGSSSFVDEYVSSAVAFAGTKSLLMINNHNTGGALYFPFDLVNTALLSNCPAAGDGTLLVSGKIYFSQIGASGSTFRIDVAYRGAVWSIVLISTGSAYTQFYAQTGDNTSPFALHQGTTKTVSITTGGWHTFGLNGFYCNNGGLGSPPSGYLHACFDSYCGYAPPPNVQIVGTAGQTSLSLCHCGGSGNEIAYLDDVEMAGASYALGSPTASVSVTDLQSFYVTPFHTGLGIARFATSEPTEIRTYDPTSLGQQAAETNSCNMVDGITAYLKSSNGATYAGYLDCSGSDTAELKIRNGLLQDPDLSGSSCSGNDFCDDFGNYHLVADIRANGVPVCTGGSGVGFFSPDTAQLGNIQSVPIDFSTSHEGELLTGAQSVVGFAYTNSDNGRLGIFVDKLFDNDEDVSCFQEYPFAASTGTPISICTWRDRATGLDYILGAAASGGSRVWRVSIDPHLATIPDKAADIDVTVWRSFSAPYDKLRGVACGSGGIVAVQTDAGSIYVLNVTAPSLQKVAGPFVGTTTARGVALSSDQRWVAYLSSSTEATVAGASNGTAVASITLPGGTFRSLWLSDTGTSAWVATSTTIARYAIGTVTGSRTDGTRCTGSACVVVGPDGEDLGPTPSTPDTGGVGLPGLDKDKLSEVTGLTSVAAGWLLGLLLVAALSFGFHSVNPKLAPIGGFLAVGIAVAFGYIELWFILLGVLVSAALIVLRVSSPRGTS